MNSNNLSLSDYQRLADEVNSEMDVWVKDVTAQGHYYRYRRSFVDDDVVVCYANDLFDVMFKVSFSSTPRYILRAMVDAYLMDI